MPGEHYFRRHKLHKKESPETEAKKRGKKKKKEIPKMQVLYDGW